MMPPSTDTRTMREYLLGALPDSESAAVESAYFASEQALDQVAEAECELIDDFLSDRLSSGERRRFQEHYLGSPVHRERLRLAQALRERAGVKRSRLLRRSFAAVLAATVLIAVTVLFLQSRTGDGDRRPATATLTLSAILPREGAGMPTLRLAPEVTWVELRIETGDLVTSPPWRASLRTVEGSEVWSGRVVPAQESEASDILGTVSLPAARLPPGDYVLSVFRLAAPADATALQRYAFSVLR